MSHVFGGKWTQTKLAVISKYLSSYSTALKNQSFKLHYADAFAGTGSQNPEQHDVQADLIPLEAMRGSARIALDTPGFQEYHFNDLKPAHVRALLELKDEYPQTKINITNLDANDFIAEFCASLSQQDRAVLFVDPYATELQWQSLERIAKTKNVDLWLLFPIASLTRMTPREGAMKGWERKVTALLGTEDWTNDFYVKEPFQGSGSLFDETPEFSIERISMDGLQGYITSRLREIFPFASDPMRIRNSKTTLFYLYFAMSNDSPKAVGLAKKIVGSILR